MAQEKNGRIIIHVDRELKELVPGFLEHRRQDIPVLQSALAGGDFATIQRLAHVMKGSGGGYGFDLISEIGASMEQAAIHKDGETLRENLMDIIDYLERVEVIYGS